MDPVNFVDPEGKTGWKSEIPAAQQGSSASFLGSTAKYFGGIYTGYSGWQALTKSPDWRVKCLGMFGIGVGTYFTAEGAEGLAEIKAPVSK